MIHLSEEKNVMMLYRARSLSSCPKRLPAFDGNEPSNRIRGRWFTSVKDDAVAYGSAAFQPRSWELVCVEVPDDIVDSLRVATTPNTVDGLAPIDYADKPETEYVIQTFRAVQAKSLAMGVAFRVRDYIDINQHAAVTLPCSKGDRLPMAA